MKRKQKPNASLLNTQWGEEQEFRYAGPKAMPYWTGKSRPYIPMNDMIERNLIALIAVAFVLFAVSLLAMGCASENGERSPNSCDVCSHMVAPDAGVDSH